MNYPINIYDIARNLQARNGVSVNVPASHDEDTVRLRVPLNAATFDRRAFDAQKATIVALGGGGITIPAISPASIAPPRQSIAEHLKNGAYLKAAVVPGSGAGKYEPDEIRLRAKNLVAGLGGHAPKTGKLGLISQLLDSAGIDHKVIAPNVEGAWKNDLDPHIAIDVKKGDRDRAALLLGHALKQDAIGSETSAKDGANALRFRIAPPIGGLTRDHFDEIRQHLASSTDSEVDSAHYPTPEMRHGAKHADVVMFNVNGNTDHRRIGHVATSVARAMESAGLSVSPKSLTLHGAATDYHDTENAPAPSDPRTAGIASRIRSISEQHFDR